MSLESMCDSCMAPGHCCRRMHLSGGPSDDRIDQPMSFERAEHLAMKFGLWMFRPAFQDPESHAWQWWCTALQRDGRCGIYEDRPALCRQYAPGQDGLCVHYWKAESEGAPA